MNDQTRRAVMADYADEKPPTAAGDVGILRERNRHMRELRAALPGALAAEAVKGVEGIFVAEDLVRRLAWAELLLRLTEEILKRGDIQPPSDATSSEAP